MPLPTVTKVTPVNVLTTGGSTITLAGTRFETGMLVVFQGSERSLVTAKNVTSTSCTAVTPVWPQEELIDVRVRLSNNEESLETEPEGHNELGMLSPPPSFTEVTIKGTFHDASGKALSGVVEAKLSGVMQNGNITASPKNIKAKVVNGVLTMKLFANDDPGTLPAIVNGNVFYTFRISLGGVVREEFKAVVPHANPNINIAELREKSGQVGVPASNRPVLPTNATNQQIVEALGFLGLVEVKHVQVLLGEVPR